MGFKKNFCCCCCCAKKPKKYVRSAAILFIILSILNLLQCLTQLNGKGGALAFTVINMATAIIAILFSIWTLCNIKKNKWAGIRCYGIFMTILTTISLLILIISLILYMLAVGIISGAVSDSGHTAAIIGFALIFAVIIYGLMAWLTIWQLVVAYNVIKASDHMEDKIEEKAEKKTMIGNMPMGQDQPYPSHNVEQNPYVGAPNNSYPDNQQAPMNNDYKF